jgi:excisionase family DNA binding protein
MIEPLWKPEDCCKYLQVGRTVLYELMRRKVDPLPYLRVGSRRRFDSRAVQAWSTRQGGNVVEPSRLQAVSVDTPRADRFIYGAKGN